MKNCEALIGNGDFYEYNLERFSVGPSKFKNQSVGEAMLSVKMSLLSRVTCFVIRLIFTILIMLHINGGFSAKSKKKISKDYAYFDYPIYKKVFLAGLRGAVPIAAIVMTWVVNFLFLCLLGRFFGIF